MPVVLVIIGMLGVGVTFAEPAIGALQAFGSSVDVTRAPYLYEVLNNRPVLGADRRGRCWHGGDPGNPAVCAWVVSETSDL